MGLLGSILKSVASHQLDKIIRKAEQGDPGAQNSLGLTYQSGDGVPQHYAEAAKWFRKSAEQGYGAAQLNLGNLLAEGRGVERDLAEAYKWIFLARCGAGGWIVREGASQDLARLRALMTPDQIAEAEKLLSPYRPPPP